MDEALNKILDMGVGYIISALPIVGNIYSITQAGVTLKDIADNAEEEAVYDETNHNYYYSGLSTYNTRATQAAHYGNLIRGSAIALNSTNNNSLLFRENDYAKGVFNISHTDRADGIMPYGKIYFDIAMKVVNRDRTSQTAFLNSNAISIDINSPYTKTVSAFNTNDFYMLPEENQTFSFTPQYTSNYTITQTGNTSQVFVNGVQQTAQNGVCNVYMKKNTAYTIQFRNTSTTSACYGTFKIEYATGGANNNVALDYNDTYVVRYKPTSSGFYTIDVGTNAVLADVYTLNESNGFAHSHSCYEKRVYEGYFTGGVDYYIHVKKTQNVADNATVEIAPVTRTFVVGENPSISLNAGDNYVYYKIVVPSNAPANQRYNFTFAGLTTSNLSYYFRTETGAGYNISAVGVGYVYTQSLEAGKTYYLGIKCPIDATVTPTYTIGEASHLWTIYKDGGTTPYATTSADEILLTRGHSYTFVLTVDDVFINPLTYTGPEQSNYDGNGTISVSSVIDITASTSIKGPNGMFSLGIQYTVDPSEITITADYVNQVKLDFTLPSGIIKIYYEITGIDPNGTSFKVTGSQSGNTINILNKLVEKNALESVRFSIVAITVNKSAGVGTIDIPTINIGEWISCEYTYSERGLFGSVNIYITNALQLNNARYYTWRDIYFGNDINLAQYYPSWTPIAEFNAIMHDEFKTINGLNITIKNNDTISNYGLIGKTTKAQSSIIIRSVNIATEENYNQTRQIFVGSIAGISEGGGFLQCGASGSIIVHNPVAAVGGIVGKISNNNVYMCGFGRDDQHSLIRSSGDIGGIAGHSVDVEFNTVAISYSTIESYVVSGNSRSTGGIVGYMIRGSAINCTITSVNINNTNSTLVTSDTPKMGYVVGHAAGVTTLGADIENCSYNIAKLQHKSYCFKGSDLYYGLSTES